MQAPAVLATPMAALSDPARLEELGRTRLLDSEPEESFDRLTRLATRLLATPVALVSLVDDRRQFFKSEVGLGLRETPLSHSFCQYVVATGEPLLISDSREDSLVAHNLAVRDLDVIAYAGFPLITSGGHVLGSFCVIDSERRVWDDEELATLQDLAALVVSEIEFRLKVHQIAEITAIGKRLDEPLNGLTDDIETLLRLIASDHDPRLARFSMRADMRVRDIRSILREVQAIREPSASPRGRSRAVDLHKPIGRAVAAARLAAGDDGIDFAADADPVAAVCDQWALEQAISHLLISAVHHSVGSSAVRVRLSRDDGQARLDVSVGAAIPPGGIVKIVSRMLSAISGDPDAGGQAAARVESLPGEFLVSHGPVQVRSGPAVGTTFTVTLPLTDLAILP